MNSSPGSTGTHPRRRRILLLNWRDTGHPEGGGSEHVIEQVAQGLHKHGYDVTLRCAHYAGAAHNDRIGDVPVVRRGGRFTVYLRAMVHLLARPNGYDLIVDVQNGVPFWSPLVSRKPVIALVHHVHREVWPVVFGPKMARLGWWLESYVAPRVYSRCPYVTVSSATLRQLVELGVDPERITVIYNGLDVTTPVPDNPSKTGSPSLVVLGRLVPHKRVELAIEAVAALRRDFPDITLTVIGRGYWEPELRGLAEHLGVSDAVTFTGFVPDETKYRLLAESWVHLLPSLREGWGLAVMDAARAGTPSVAYRSAGGTNDSIVDGQTGLLLSDDDSLAERLADLLHRPDHCRRLGDAAREYSNQFSWETSVERFEELARLVIEDTSTRLPLPALPSPTRRLAS